MQVGGFRGLLLAFVVASTALAGCAGGDAAPEETQGPGAVATLEPTTGTEAGTIRGSVTTDEGIPIGGATVGIVGLDAEAKTGDNGSFEFRGVTPGTYGVAVNKLGFESVAKSVEVLPGEVAEVTIELAAIVVSDPYFLSIPHAVLHEIGEKWATWALSLAEVDQCSGCTWTDTPPEGSTHMLVEIFGAHSIAKPTGDREWYWLFDEGNGNGSEITRGEFDLPIRIELEEDDYEGTTNFWSQILCEEQWICFQERRDVWVTFFYEYDEIPEGFTAAPPE